MSTFNFQIQEKHNTSIFFPGGELAPSSLSSVDISVTHNAVISALPLSRTTSPDSMLQARNMILCLDTQMFVFLTDAPSTKTNTYEWINLSKYLPFMEEIKITYF